MPTLPPKAEDAAVTEVRPIATEAAAAGAAVRRRRRRPAGVLHAGAAVLSGCMVFCAFPGPSVHPLIWVGLVPLLFVLDGTHRPRRGFLLGWLAGTVTNLGGFYWISSMLGEFGHLPDAAAWGLTVLNAAYQGLAFGVFGWLAVRLYTPGLFHRLVTLPCLMILAEASVPYIFPWYLGNGLQPQTAAFQWVELLGVPATSGLVVAVNAVLARGLRMGLATRRVPLRSLLAAGGILAGVFGLGAWRLAQVDAAAAVAPVLRVGMVEADVGIWEKQARGFNPSERRVALRGNLLRHQRLSAEVAATGAELVVWPESSYVPFRGTGIKRTDTFALARTRDDTLRIQTGDGRFKTLSEVPGAEVLREVDGRIRAVVGGREDSALVLARGGRIFRLDAEGWREELTSVALNLNAAWAGTSHRATRRHLRARSVDCVSRAAVGGSDGGRGPCDLPAVAVGEGGTWLRRIRGIWVRADTPTHRDLLAVAGLVATEIYAVGAGGTVVRDDGRSLRIIHEGGPTLRAVAVSARGRVAAVGDDCRVLLKPIGARFREMKVEGCSERLRAVTFLPDGRMVAGGRGGTLIYEEARGGSLRYRQLQPRSAGADPPYLRVLDLDSRGRTVAALGDGTLLDLSDPASESPPELGQVGAPLYRIAFVGFLWDRAIPSDARWLYRSERPLPEGESREARVAADEDTPDLDRDAVQRGFATHLLFGAITYRAEEVLQRGGPVRDNIQNTAILLDPRGRVLGMSHKIRLLIFGEYLPFEDLIPALRKWIPEAGNFKAGKRVRPLRMAALPPGLSRKIVPLICYEDILPSFGDVAVSLAPDLLVNVTNDAWFGETSEPALHLQLAAARGVEARRTMVRSTNTGISAFVDAAGRILDPTSLQGAETRLRDVPIPRLSSWYGLPARVIYWGAILWSAILLLGRMVRSAASRPRQSTGPREGEAGETEA